MQNTNFIRFTGLFITILISLYFIGNNLIYDDLNLSNYNLNQVSNIFIVLTVLTMLNLNPK